jgi:sulfite reductase (ferredoxin)
VSLVEFDLADAEREVFEAQLALEAGDAAKADALAYHAMLQAAKALVKTQVPDVGDDAARIVSEFKTRFVDTELFFDRFAKGMVAGYLFRRHDEGAGKVNAESSHQLVEEASLFVEAGHACQLRMMEKKVGPAAATASQVVSLEGLN